MPTSLRVILLISVFTIVCRANAQSTRQIPTPTNEEIANLQEKANRAHAVCGLQKYQGYPRRKADRRLQTGE